MADFILREKEFRKLNEKLDDDFKRSTTLSKIEKFKETRQNPLTSICYDTYRVDHQHHKMGRGSSNNDRFAIYTKERCSTNLSSMRKVGGGDCVTTAAPLKTKSPTTSPKRIITTTTTTAKANYGNTFHQRAKSLPKGATGTGGGGGGGVGAVGGGLIVKETKRNSIEDQYISKTMALVPSSRKITPPKDTLVVYKNEKFTASSSMDDILKKNLFETNDGEKETKARTSNCSNYLNKLPPPRADSTQPMESIGLGGGKATQKIVNTSSLIRFLKSKVALLEEHQARNVDEMQQQKSAYETTLERQKSLTQQLEKAQNRNTALTEQLEKMNSQLIDSNRRCREQSQECLTLKKELENVKRDLKHLTLNYTNLEKRFMRTKEETETAQKSCTSMRQSERDLKENFRREIEAKNAEIKYLKKQRSDLFNAYKKQLFLIDNLRQQNICMEQAKMIDFCEKEFSKILEWNLKA